MKSSPVLVSPDELSRQLAAATPPLLVDVRLAEDYATGHLPAAKNNCVLEVVFLDRMKSIAPDKTAPVCVYGAAADSHEARMAAEKLCRAGYQSVQELREGLEGWSKAGLPLENEKEAEAKPQILDGEHRIDLKESRVEWIGRGLLSKHHGSIGLKAGLLHFQGGQAQDGTFTLDMTKIASDDLAGNPLHDVLIAHLQSDDFFDVELYPEARFVIRSTEPMRHAAHGTPNLTVRGELTLKGQTLPVTFAATAGITPEGKAAAQAEVFFDRTKWDVIYGSGRFFRKLGGHLVNDLIEVHLRIVTE